MSVNTRTNGNVQVVDGNIFFYKLKVYQSIIKLSYTLLHCRKIVVDEVTMYM